jgi:hypothetical protein
VGKKEGMKEATVDDIFIEVFSASTKAVYLAIHCYRGSPHFVIFGTTGYHEIGGITNLGDSF